jgi:hypothetical protein
MKAIVQNQVVFCAALLLFGCGGSEPPEQHEEDPAEHACEQAGTAGTALDGAAARGADIAELVQADTPYTVSLDQAAPVYVRLSGPANGLLFSAPADVVSALYFETGAVNELPQGAPNEFCPDAVPEHFDLALEQTGTYYVELGPAAVDSAWLLYGSAEGHAH